MTCACRSNENIIYTLFREGTYLTIVVNLPYGPQTITIANKNTQEIIKS